MKASSYIFRSLVLALLFISIYSCKKDLSTIGLDMVSPGELIRMGYIDTVSITAYSVAEDSVRTGNLSYAMIGSMNDAVFGTTQAGFYTQIRLSEEPTDLGANVVFDSAFLILPYVSAYGDTLSNMTIRVFELAEPLVDSVHNYSNESISYQSNAPIGELTFTPRPSDSAYYSGSTQAPAIRIPLNEKFGFKMIQADTTDLKTNEAFLEYCHGIAVIAEKQEAMNKGSILRFALTTGKSKIVMHYHNSTDTSSYNFLINADCDRFNSFDHDSYSGASPLMLQQMGGDTTLGKEYLFLQSMGGVKVKMKFPNLKKWADKQHVLINDAQLIFTNADPSETFTAPSSLVIYPMLSDGTLYPYQLSDASDSYVDYDGTYNEDDHTYRFRIPGYVQQVLNGDQTDYGLFLLIPSSSISSSRLVMHGPGSGASSLKLYLKYTIVN